MTKLQPKQEEEIIQEINPCYDECVSVQHSSIFIMDLSCSIPVATMIIQSELKQVRFWSCSE